MENNHTLLILPSKISGNKDSEKALIFLHGWPDNIDLFDDIVNDLKKDYLCVQLSYPNYNDKIILKWGLDFPEIIKNIKYTLDNIHEINGKDLIFIVHDWGCYFTYLFDIKYPKIIKEIIAMDVGAKLDNKFSIIAYQLWLANAFLIGGPIGNWMTKKCIAYFKYDPVRDIDSSINYNYYYLWRKIFLNLLTWKKESSSYTPSCPVVYLYGKKPFYFHNKKWLDLLKVIPGSEYHEFENGHWFFLKHRKMVIDIILRRLKSKF